MRLASIAPFGLPHSNECDATFRGYTIPKGTFVQANVWAILRDPKIWPSADEFDPGNFLNEAGEIFIRPEFIPFATGE